MYTPNPLVTQLGYPADARLVIFHADDVGMCHGSNQAYLELMAAGLLQTGSVMVPCPWSPELLHACQQNPSLDIGVHLTLTSEWSGYRWGPISTRDVASGLLDEAGHFWPRVPGVQAHLNVAAAMTEMHAQIERVRSMGIDFTHLDTHMGAALLPELVEAYVAWGFTYGVPVLLPRQIDDYVRTLGLVGPDEQAWLNFVRAIEAKGMPLVDWFRITPGYHLADPAADRAVLYEALLHNLPPGVTYFSLHPNAPGDIEVIVPERAYWRTFEYHYFQSQRLRDFLRAEAIIPIGYHAIRTIMRANS
ncbi:MAG: polysaccharide deacetylase family protein [Caldilineaceae bacterium]|nr:polysaccharide deacetylase family protein [Caldilineaceae bacterium]